MPSPVRVGERFCIKAGAKSAGGCDLGGAHIEVRDVDDTVLCEGPLSHETWPGTAGLHWTELELTAPETAGMFTWSVSFAATEELLPHEGSSSRFSFAAARPPNTRLSVRVLQKESGATIADAKLTVGVHKGATDDTGTSLLEIPDGRYTLTVWKAGYEAVSHQLEVTQDQEIEIDLNPLPAKRMIWL